MISQLIPQTTMAILSIVASLCTAFVTSPRTILKPSTKSMESQDPNFVMNRFSYVSTYF